MKRQLLLAVLVASMLFSTVSAFAADFIPDKEGYYNDVTYTTSDVALTKGSLYGFVVVKGIDKQVLDLSDDNLKNIIYINQAECTDGSTLSFGTVGLMGDLPSADTFEGGTAYIGGGSLGTAKKVGNFLPQPKGANIKGTVSNPAMKGDKTATVTVLKGKEEIASKTGVTGAFELLVPFGTYTVTVTKDTCLTYTYENVAVEDVDVSIGEVDMDAAMGDAKPNGEININDVQVVIDDYNHKGAEIVDKNADVNANGEININDLDQIISNYNKKNSDLIIK